MSHKEPQSVALSVIEQAIIGRTGRMFIKYEFGSRMREFENREVTLKHENKSARVRFGSMEADFDNEGKPCWVLDFIPVYDNQTIELPQ